MAKDFNPEDYEEIDMNDYEELEPSTQELSPYVAVPSIVAQDLSMGLSDELLGAGQTAAQAVERAYERGLPEDTLSGNLKALYNKYQQNRDAQRDLIQQSQEQYPMTSMASTVGSMLVPGLGLAKAAKGISTGAKIANATKQGAKLGALGGAAYSEEEALENPLSLAADTAQGAALGGVLGGTFETLAGALSSKGQQVLANESPEFLDDVIDAYKYGRQGVNLTSKSAKEQLEKDVTKESRDLLARLKKAERSEGQKMSSVNKAAKEAGKTIDIRDSLLNLVEELDMSRNTDNAALQEYLVRQFKMGTKLTPEEFQTFRRGLADFSKTGTRTLKDPYLAGKVVSSVKSLDDAVQEGLGPEFADQLSKARAGVSSVKTAQDILNAKVTGIDVEDFRSGQKIASKIKRLSDPSDTGARSRESFDEANKRMSNAGYDLNEDVTRIKDLSRRYDLAKDVSAGSRNNLIPFTSAVSGSANIAGRGVKKASEMSKATIESIAKMTPESLRSFSQSVSNKAAALGQTDAGQKVVRAFEQMEGKPERTRQALVFGLMQNPAYRSLIMEDKENSADIDNNYEDIKE